MQAPYYTVPLFSHPIKLDGSTSANAGPSIAEINETSDTDSDASAMGVESDIVCPFERCSGTKIAYRALLDSHDKLEYKTFEVTSWRDKYQRKNHELRLALHGTQQELYACKREIAVRGGRLVTMEAALGQAGYQCVQIGRDNHFMVIPSAHMQPRPGNLQVPRQRDFESMDAGATNLNSRNTRPFNTNRYAAQPAAPVDEKVNQDLKAMDLNGDKFTVPVVITDDKKLEIEDEVAEDRVNSASERDCLSPAEAQPSA
ncbi:hypothetical protein MBLNU230_g0250t1 [Neophaeotheca triangularis]